MKKPNLLNLGAIIALATVSATSALAQDAKVIPKPAPHNGQGQEAGRSCALAGDFALMGAYMIGDRFQDSGGAYLFENGNTTPRQKFQLTGSLSYDFQSFSTDGQGNVVPGAKTECSFTEPQINGMYLGLETAMSERWVALAGNDLGHDFNEPHQQANCAGESGRVPTILLASKVSNHNHGNPYSGLNYAINSPFRENIRDMAVSDTDLVVVAGKGAHVYSFDEAADEWNYNTTLLPTKQLGDYYYEGLAMDHSTIVLGSPDENKIYWFRKNNGTWSLETSMDMTDNPQWGRALDFEGILWRSAARATWTLSG